MAPEEANMSILDRIRAADRLSIDIQPAIKVFCVCCNQHIGHLKSAKGGIENFVPLKHGKTDNALLCPVCGKIFTAFKHIDPEPKFKTDRGYLP